MLATSSNLHTGAPFPASAMRLAKLGLEHGWTVRTLRTHGTRLLAKKETDNVTVRLLKDGRSLVGVWVDSSFSAGLVGLSGQQLMVTLQSRELVAAVRNG